MLIFLFRVRFALRLPFFNIENSNGDKEKLQGTWSLKLANSLFSCSILALRSSLLFSTCEDNAKIEGTLPLAARLALYISNLESRSGDRELPLKLTLPEISD
jgi:hypothetical protein